MAATTNFLIVINSPPSVSITFLPEGPETAPVAPGTRLGIFVVTPPGWSGAVDLSGPDGSLFSLGMIGGVPTLFSGLAPLSARTYNLTATASP